MTEITGTEQFWGPIKGLLNQDQLAVINMSPTLVAELNNYEQMVTSKNATMKPISVDYQTGTGDFLQFVGNGIEFGANWQTWSVDKFVGNLSHELGHLISYDSDKSFFQKFQIDPTDPNAGRLYSTIGLRAEGEAVLINYKIQQEILSRGGPKIILNGDASSKGDLQSELDRISADNVRNGLSQDAANEALLNMGATIYSRLHPSGEKGDVTYADYFFAHGKEIFGNYGSSGAGLRGEFSGVDFSKFTINGTSSIEFLSDNGTTQELIFSSGVLSGETIKDQLGSTISHAVYTRDGSGGYTSNFYTGDGKLTDQSVYRTDGSSISTSFGANGSKSIKEFNTSGGQTSLTRLDQSGFKTQIITYDPANGTVLNRIDYVVGGGERTFQYQKDGSGTGYATNAQGARIEDFSFNSSGKLISDTQYSNGGEKKVFSYNSDGSGVSTLYSGNGAATDYIEFNATGNPTREVKYFNGGDSTIITYDGNGSSKWDYVNRFGTLGTTTYVDSSNKITAQASYDRDGKLQSYDTYTYNSNGSHLVHTVGTNGVWDSLYLRDGANGLVDQKLYYANGTLKTEFQNDPNIEAPNRIDDYDRNGRLLRSIIYSRDENYNETQRFYDGSGHFYESITPDFKTHYYNSSGAEVASLQLSAADAATKEFQAPSGSNPSDIYKAAIDQTNAIISAGNQKFKGASVTPVGNLPNQPGFPQSGTPQIIGPIAGGNDDGVIIYPVPTPYVPTTPIPPSSNGMTQNLIQAMAGAFPTSGGQASLALAVNNQSHNVLAANTR
ncbi:hypothetical protein [Burkholderia ubonensis]|uniref:hypothetical protein n=1 Tax=Burkholderia ubonensis TaxID=101571 RepID=UPI000A905BDB|nr:hypothetical protein [Burkholderia ubonensis]